MTEASMVVLDLHSIGEVAASLGVSPYTLRGWIAERKIGSYKVGKRVLLSQADITAFLQDQHRAPVRSAGNGNAA